jgi:hypothetical protein
MRNLSTKPPDLAETTDKIHILTSGQYNQQQSVFKRILLFGVELCLTVSQGARLELKTQSRLNCRYCLTFITWRRLRVYEVFIYGSTSQMSSSSIPNRSGLFINRLLSHSYYHDCRILNSIRPIGLSSAFTSQQH